MQKTPQDNNVFYQIDTSDSFKVKNDIPSSEIQDSENPDNELLCQKCNKIFSTLGNLRNHIRSIHLNYRPFKCHFPNCNKTYLAKSKLIIHERTHTGIKPYVCQICQKSFNEKGNLKAHLNFHSEIRPFKCPLCDKGYKSYLNLRDHIKIFHYKIKKFCCQYCQKYFARISALKEHIRTHTKEKRFVCKFEGCGKRFTEKRNMEKHYERHFNDMAQTKQKIKNKKIYGPKKIENDFENKIKVALNQLDYKNKKQAKTEIKKEKKMENKIDINSVLQKDSLNQNCFDDIKYSYINNFSNCDNTNNPPNAFPLMTNLQSSYNLNDTIIKDDINCFKNGIFRGDVYFINNINNYNYINYNYFMGTNNNNYDKILLRQQNNFV